MTNAFCLKATSYRIKVSRRLQLATALKPLLLAFKPLLAPADLFSISHNMAGLLPPIQNKSRGK